MFSLFKFGFGQIFIRVIIRRQRLCLVYQFTKLVYTVIVFIVQATPTQHHQQQQHTTNNSNKIQQSKTKFDAGVSNFFQKLQITVAKPCKYSWKWPWQTVFLLKRWWFVPVLLFFFRNCSLTHSFGPYRLKESYGVRWSSTLHLGMRVQCCILLLVFVFFEFWTVMSEIL